MIDGKTGFAMRWWLCLNSSEFLERIYQKIHLQSKNKVYSIIYSCLRTYYHILYKHIFEMYPKKQNKLKLNCLAIGLTDWKHHMTTLESHTIVLFANWLQTKVHFILVQFPSHILFNIYQTTTKINTWYNEKILCGKTKKSLHVDNYHTTTWKATYSKWNHHRKPAMLMEGSNIVYCSLVRVRLYHQNFC